MRGKRIRVQYLSRAKKEQRAAVMIWLASRGLRGIRARERECEGIRIRDRLVFEPGYE